MKVHSNTQLLRGMKEKGSIEQLVAGHSQVPSKAALYNLRFQTRKELDVCDDPLLDMVSRCSDRNKDFVRHVSFPPFTAFLMKQKQAQSFQTWHMRTDFRRAYLDATGSILAKMRDSVLLHHVLLIQMKIADDNNHTPFCLSEIISASQSMRTITDFLTRAQDTIKEDCQQTFSLMFHEIVTDKSFANIGAIVRSFNDMNLSGYLDLCWKILQDDVKAKKKLKTLVVVRLCSSHTTKTMSDLLKKYYKDREVCFKLASLIGIMFNIGDIGLLLQYARIFLFGLSTPKLGVNANANSAALKATMEKVKEYLNKEDTELFNQDDFFTGLEDVRASSAEEDTQSDDQSENVIIHNAIYKNSKCYQELNDYLRGCEFDSEGEENKFYSPSFASDFLKNHLSYVLLWGRPMTYLRSKEACRANNGPIENHFMQKKKDAREANLMIGAFGKVVCGRYVQFLSEVADTTIKSIEYDIPSRSRSRSNLGNGQLTRNKPIRSKSQPNEMTEDGILESTEMYKKKSSKPKKRSVFFSQRSLTPSQ